jgi:hypothetical protein
MLLKRYQPTWESYQGDGGTYHSNKEERDGKLFEYWNHGIDTHRTYSKPVVEDAIAHLVSKYHNFDKLEITINQYGKGWSASASKGATSDWDTVNWFHRECRNYLEAWTNYTKPEASPTSDNAVTISGIACRVIQNAEKGGIEVHFTNRVPSEKVAPLQNLGFRWAKRKPSYLWAKYSESRWNAAIALATTLNGTTKQPAELTTNNCQLLLTAEQAIAEANVQALQISSIDKEPSPVDKPEIIHTPPDLQRFEYGDITLEVWESRQSHVYFVTDETGKCIRHDNAGLFYAGSHEDAAQSALELWRRDRELEQLKAELDRVNQENAQLKEEIDRLTPPPTPPSGGKPTPTNVVEFASKQAPITQAEQALIEIVQLQGEVFGDDVVALLEENRALMRDILAEQKPKQTRKPTTEKPVAKPAPTAAKPRRRKKDKVCEGQIPLFDFSTFTQLNLFAV